MSTERIVKVRLTAQMDSYVSGMEKASKATREVGTEAEKLAETKKAFDLLGRASLAAGGLLAAGLGVAVAKFAEFDEAMSFVKAATGETVEAMGDLRQAALDAGARTVFSATEAANAIEELAKAGVSTADILSGGLDGALDLAAAGGLGVADAAGIAATALKTFNLEGSDMAHVADLLAAGAGKAMGDVTDLSAALNQSAMVANATGLSIEETTATLAAFASQGLLGSDAGTSFKSMLQRLTPQSGEAKRKMEELGIAAYDAKGEFIGMTEFAGNLQQSLKDLTPEQRNSALATIFGSDAVRAANVLYSEGERGIRDWITAVDDQGFAAEQAATRLDNLKGDWEALTGAMDTALISMGEAADGPLRGLIQGLTELVDGFNDMPAGAQQAVFWVGAVGAAGSIALGAYLLLVPKVAEFKSSLDVLGPTASRAARGVGMVAAAGSGLVAGLALASVGGDLLTKWIDSLGDSSEITSNKVKTATTAIELLDGAGAALTGKSDLKFAALQVKSLGDALDGLGSGLAPANAISNVRVIGRELGALATKDLPSAQAQFRRLAEDAGLNEKQQSKLLDQMEPYRKALVEQASELGISADAQNVLSLAMGDTAGAADDQVVALEELQGVAQDTESDVNALADAIRNFGSAQFDTERATIKFHDAFADLDSILADGAGSLDVTSEAGRNTLSTMLEVAQSTNDYAASVAAMGGSTEEVQSILESGRQKIIDTRVALGDTEEAARLYADQLVSTPATIQTQVQLLGVAAAEESLRLLTRGREIALRLSGDAAPSYTPVGLLPGRATGGAINGPGTGTSDTAGLFRLSAGEHVLTAADVAAMGGQHAVYGYRAGLHSSGGGGSTSLEGASITGTFVMGDGFVTLIDGRIAANDSSSVSARRGRATPNG